MAGTVSRRDSAPVLRSTKADISAVRGGKMLLKAAILILAVWFVGALGLSEAGNAVHALLLVGLMTLLLGVLKARDAARRHSADSRHDAR